MSTHALEKLLPREKVKGFGSRVSNRYASGRMWPHGEWSLGYGKDRPDGGDWHENLYVGLGVDDVAMVDRAGRSPVPLNLSDAPNSTKRPRRGGKGITGYGQQMIKAAGHLVQEKWPSHRKTLGTVTLPPMNQQARAEVVQRWPELTRELLRWLSRRLQRQGLPAVVLSVTEIQPKRLAESSEGYLHWHLLWLNVPAKHGQWSVEPNDVRTWLDELLRRHVPSYDGGHINVNTKAVEGVVAAYMAKYMSKGKQQVAEAVKDWGEENTPRTWWNMTAPCRAMVKASTHHGREVGALLETVLHWALEEGPDSVYAFLASIEIEMDGVKRWVGWRGRFHEDHSRGIRSMLESRDIA